MGYCANGSGFATLKRDADIAELKDKLDALVGRIGNDVLQKLLKETPKEQLKHREKSL